MKVTPAQQRLIAAAQRRRAEEYALKYAAWREQNGMAPVVKLDFDVELTPLERRQAAMLIGMIVVGCVLTSAGVIILARLIGGAI